MNLLARGWGRSISRRPINVAELSGRFTRAWGESGEVLKLGDKQFSRTRLEVRQNCALAAIFGSTVERGSEVEDYPKTKEQSGRVVEICDSYQRRERIAA